MTTQASTPTHSLRRRIATLGVAVVSLASGLAGCSGGPAVTVDEFAAYAQPLAEVRLPAEVDRARVVAMGEATHGNAELIDAKRQVFSTLVEDHGYRVFAIEADFGGGVAVDDYVRTGRGSAVAAVKQIGFPIYQNQQLVDQVEWIRDHNAAAGPKDQIRFYGFDFQRYDRNKAGLDRYLRSVDPTVAKESRDRLASLTDAGFRTLDDDAEQAAADSAQQVLDRVAGHRDAYLAKSSSEAYELAEQYARVIWQGATWRANDADASTRDGFMAENVRWIMAREEQRQDDSRAQVFLSGHNGHVAQVSAGLFTAMGANLVKEIGEADYYALGTEFVDTTFTVAGVGSRGQYRVTNSDGRQWAELFGSTEPGFVDFDAAAANPQLADFLSTSRRMGNVGNEFTGVFRFLPFTYTLKMKPAEAYDGLVFAQTLTPSTLLD
jgi:erythromycin esterase